MSEQPTSGTVEVLARVPLFSCFTEHELREVAQHFVEVSFHKNDVICKEGDVGDAFYVVLSGELEVWGGKHQSVVISRLGPGEVLGEMSLLTGAKRAATVTASRNAKLLALSKADFDRYFLQNAKALEYFSKILCKRLASLARGEAVAQATTTIGVIGEHALKGKTLVAATVAGLLRDFTKRSVLLVNLHRLTGRGRRARSGTPLLTDIAEETVERIRSRLTARKADPMSLTLGVRTTDTEHVCAAGLSALITKLSEEFPFMVLDLGTDREVLSQAGEGVCNVLIKLVADAQPVPEPQNGRAAKSFQVVNLFNKSSAPLPINHCEPFVMRTDSALAHHDTWAQAEYIRTHPWSPASPALHRLARKILGISVGIALGGGAAFGVAHVGVFRVLEDNNIPIDLVAGCSMGSIVGIGYAAGIRAQQMIDIASRIGNVRTTMSALDVNLTRPGFLAGNRMIKIFSPLMGPVQNFEDLYLPCRAVATDIETGERVLLGSGRLDAAFRASASVPMIWSPVKHDGRILVDGGVVDPVPAEVVNGMGADVCIAVNAVPQLKKGVDTVLSRLSRVMKRFDPLSYLGASQDFPNLFDIIMNTIQTLQYELGNFKAIAADVRINLNLSDYTWIEFYRAKELIERGAVAAERAVPEIKRVLAERLAKSVAASEHRS
jgi:NTE family protein